MLHVKSVCLFLVFIKKKMQTVKCLNDTFTYIFDGQLKTFLHTVLYVANKQQKQQHHCLERLKQCITVYADGYSYMLLNCNFFFCWISKQCVSYIKSTLTEIITHLNVNLTSQNVITDIFERWKVDIYLSLVVPAFWLLYLILYYIQVRFVHLNS